MNRDGALSASRGLMDAWPRPSGWTPLLADLFASPKWESLAVFVDAERRQGPVWPPPEQVFDCFRLTPPESVRVVILGQDPYHRPGQAHGLGFSVPPGVPVPPSLRNIFRELQEDLGIATPRSGDLSAWARSGVLLLNSLLTVREGQPLSHRGRGWEWFTDRVIETVAGFDRPVAFVLWGATARSKAALLGRDPLVIESAHPSPLSVRHGFRNSRPFSRVNAMLAEHRVPPVDWRLERDS